ncbi:MAG TPA: LTA synthase family protein, partial [Polyangiaceae bacterium]|nr:LTA synthase family protein [Polyangiaceae bacterium]
MLKPKLRASGAWFPLRFGILNAAVMLLQLPVLVVVFDWSGPYSVRRVALILLCLGCGIVTINAPLQLLAAVVAKRRWARLCTAAAVMLTHTVCAAHRVRSHASVDLSAVFTNAHMTSEAWSVAFDTLSGWMLGFGLVLLVLVGHLELRRPVMRLQPGPRWRSVSLCAVAYLGLVIAPLPLGDELSRVAQSNWYRRQPKKEFAVKLKANEYPLVHAAKSTPVQGSRHPDVFLLLVESFRSAQVEKTAPNGKTYTPFFNELIKRGLYVEHFYGNSIQTRKGQFASLCSLIPSLSGSEFEDYDEKRLDCLPQALKRQGYTTTFFQAYRDLSYDNTEQFMRHQGFAQVETVQTYRHPEDDPYTWGWGLQDDKFYERFFEFLDRQDASAASSPQFVTLAPIGNHMHFDEMPQRSRKIYRHPNEAAQHYANSVYLADQGLREFFAQLER